MVASTSARTSRVAGYPGVYAVGDVANIPSGEDGRALPQLGRWPSSRVSGQRENIVRELHGEPAKPFVYKDKGIMAMIGRNAAVAEVGKHRHQVEGPVAFAAWLGVHAMLLSGVHSKTDAFLDLGVGLLRPRPRRHHRGNRSDPERLAWADHGEDVPHIVVDRPEATSTSAPPPDLTRPETRHGVERRDPGRQPGRAGPGHHAGHLPGGQLDLHRPTEYDLSNTQYGAMFLPQVLTAIVTSLPGARLARRYQHQAGLPARPGREHRRDGAAGGHHAPSRPTPRSPTRCCWWPPRSWGPASG